MGVAGDGNLSFVVAGEHKVGASVRRLQRRSVGIHTYVYMGGLIQCSVVRRWSGTAVMAGGGGGVQGCGRAPEQLLGQEGQVAEDQVGC